MPFVLLILFVSVHQDLRAQKLQKKMAADQERIELLGRRVQELRCSLASETEFTCFDHGIRSRGLRPAHGDQVLAVAPGAAAGPADGPPADLAGRIVTGLVAFLGPPAAQAESHGDEPPAGGEDSEPRSARDASTGRVR